MMRTLDLLVIELDKFFYLVLAGLEIGEIKIEAIWDDIKHLLLIFLAVGFKTVD